jgi:hypothetical protein
VGQRSREKRARRAARGEAGSGAEAGGVKSRRNALVGAAIAAAIVGFAAGWLVRVWLDRTPEFAARETSEAVRERVLEKTP